MLNIKDYQEQILKNQAELRSEVLALMAKENMKLRRVAIEAGISWPTIKRFLTSQGRLSNETIEKLKDWMDSYQNHAV